VGGPNQHSTNSIEQNRQSELELGKKQSQGLGTNTESTKVWGGVSSSLLREGSAEEAVLTPPQKNF